MKFNSAQVKYNFAKAKLDFVIVNFNVSQMKFNFTNVKLNFASNAKIYFRYLMYILNILYIFQKCTFMNINTLYYNLHEKQAFIFFQIIILFRRGLQRLQTYIHTSSNVSHTILCQ